MACANGIQRRPDLGMQTREPRQALNSRELKIRGMLKPETHVVRFMGPSYMKPQLLTSFSATTPQGFQRASCVCIFLAYSCTQRQLESQPIGGRARLSKISLPLGQTKCVRDCNARENWVVCPGLITSKPKARTEGCKVTFDCSFRKGVSFRKFCL